MLSRREHSIALGPDGAIGEPVCSIQGGCRVTNLAARHSWLAATGLLLAFRLAPAQEALRNSLAGESAATQRLQSESRPYSFRSKTGDFRLLVVPSLALEWNDNINTSDANPEDDFILRPMVQFTASYPVTERNLLSLNVGVGYDQYLNHPGQSSWRLQSGSDLSFDLFIKDVWINLHDRFSYSQDSAQEAAVANTASYGTFNNSAGLLVNWNLSDVTLGLGYDHETVISLSQQFQSQDHATDSVVGRAGFHLHPKLTTGLEASVAFTTYAQQVMNDNTAYSVGVYADWRPGSFLQVQPRVGYSIFQFDQTSSTIQTGDLDSWYADLKVTHQVSDAISYSLSAGHDVRLGVGQSDAIDEWYVRPSLSWHILNRVTLNVAPSYEHGKQGAGNQAGNLTEIYDWFGGNLGVNYPFMSRFTLGANYRLTLRSSSVASRAYTQNLIGLTLSYQVP